MREKSHEKDPKIKSNPEISWDLGDPKSIHITNTIESWDKNTEDHELFLPLTLPRV
jgi:hypothetical protein